MRFAPQTKVAGTAGPGIHLTPRRQAAESSNTDDDLPYPAPRLAEQLQATFHPHSLKPQTWHFMQPSANSSCEPQSGQAPDSVSCMPPNTICSPLAVL